MSTLSNECYYMYIKKILRAALLIKQVDSYFIPFFRSISELFTCSNCKSYIHFIIYVSAYKMHISTLYLDTTGFSPYTASFPRFSMFLCSSCLYARQLLLRMLHKSLPRTLKVRISACQPDLLLIYPTHLCVADDSKYCG